MDKKDLIIIFTDKADNALDEIMGKYNLRETDDEILDDDEKNLPKIVIIDYLVKDFTREEISTEEFLDGLRQGLHLSPETTQALAKDIIQVLIPLLDKVPEAELEAYRDKKDAEEEKAREEQGGTLAQEILRKINAKRGIPVAEPEKPRVTADDGVPQDAVKNPVAKVPTTSVEENAKQVQQLKRDLNPASDQNMDKPAPAPDKPAPNRNFDRAKENVAENKFANEKKGPDSYREPVE